MAVIEKVVWYEPLLETKLYEGEAMDQKMHGYGKLYYPENVNDPENQPLRYEGYFHQDIMHGFGTLYRRNGIKIYEGDWHQGLYEGYGKLFNDLGKMTYEGEFKMA